MILLKEIDRKFLQPERTRGKTDHTQPKMIVSDVPCLHNFMIISMEKKKKDIIWLFHEIPMIKNSAIGLDCSTLRQKY